MSEATIEEITLQYYAENVQAFVDGTLTADMALGNFLIGCIWCITIVGIPFGKQFFKIAKLALRPFGAYVVRI